MIRSRLLLILNFLLALNAFSQQSKNSSVHVLKTLNKPFQASLDAIVQLKEGASADLLRDCEIVFSRNNIYRIRCSYSAINSLSKSPFIKRIELSKHKYRRLDDSSIVYNNVLPVHQGVNPLPQPYTGKNVIIGIIDTGTDFSHPDFKDSLGNSRILWLWDQRLANAANTPMPYNYGQEWSNTDIDNNLCTHTDITDVGHGTKVAGIAAGNGFSDSTYKGIAPKSSIISVAVDFNSSAPVITDAVDYIFAKANIAGLPCVINISLGDYFGSHDGRDLESLLMESYIANQPGKMIVTAAGNAGNYPLHIQHQIQNDTAFSFFTNNNPSIEFNSYSDSSAMNNLQFTIGFYDKNSNQFKGNIGYKNIAYCLGTIKSDTIRNASNDILGIVETSADLYDSLYTLNVSISTDSVGHYWMFENAGSGKCDVWSTEMLYTNVPTLAQYNRMNYFVIPDSNQTITTGIQCSDEVLTVANYVGRNGFVDYNGNMSLFPGTVGDLHETSSRGPTRDGRIKPDIAATGENIATTGSAPWLVWLIANYPNVVTQDSMHMIFGGTSAAAPVVAGLAALYFEKNPTATNRQLRQDVIGCTTQDNFTGAALPNTEWGYGKLNGLNALLCSSVGVSENSIINNLKIYPNPFQQQIILSDLKTEYSIRLLNAQGQTISTFSNKNNQHILNTEFLAPGLYLLEFSNESEVQRYKIVKQ